MSDATAPERDESSRPQWQRLLVLVVSSKPAAALLRKIMHRIDRPLLRLTRGRLSFVSAYPSLLLTSTGARSGKQRTVPLLYIRCASGFAIIGTRFGSTHHPGWYYNLRADPVAIVEINGAQITCRARVADESERQEIWERAVRMYSGYKRYAERTGRTIPMLILTPETERLRSVA